MTLQNHENGKIQLGCAFGVLVLVLGVWVGIQTAPVLTRVSEFDKAIGHHAERVNIPGNSQEKMIQAILDKAEELEIPISKKDIQIKKSKSQINIRIAYTLEIDYGFYVYQLHEEHDVDRVIF